MSSAIYQHEIGKKVATSLLEGNNEEKNIKLFHAFISPEFRLFGLTRGRKEGVGFTVVSIFVVILISLCQLLLVNFTEFFFTVNVYFSLKKKNPISYKMVTWH